MELAFRFLLTWQPVEALESGDELVIDLRARCAWFRRPSRVVSARIWTRVGDRFRRTFPLDPPVPVDEVLDHLDRKYGGMIFQRGTKRWDEVVHDNPDRIIFRAL